MRQNDQQPDDIYHGVAILHFLVALWLDSRLLCHSYIAIMSPKPKTTNKKQNRATTLSQRAPRKSARKHTVSVVTPQDLDSSKLNLDTDISGYAGLDLASHMDLMMSMILGLANKVNDQEEASQPQSASVHLFPAVPRHEAQKTRWQTTKAQDLELEKAVCKWAEQLLYQISLLEAAIFQDNVCIIFCRDT